MVHQIFARIETETNKIVEL